MSGHLAFKVISWSIQYLWYYTNFETAMDDTEIPVGENPHF